MPAATYFQIINEAMRLYREGKLKEANDLVTGAGDLEAGNPAQMLNFRYCIASKLGDMELAIRLMREAIVERGYWYGFDYLLKDDDLQPLQDIPEFKRLAAISREREVEAKRNSKPSMRTLKVEGSGNNQTRLLMAIHGNGDNAAVTAPYWQECLRHGYDLALPQSSQITFWDAYTWIDLDKGISELAVHLRLIQSIGVEQRDMVVAGFSGGAGLALYTVLMEEIAPIGLILMAPWLPELDNWREMLRSHGRKGLRCWIICGDKDDDCLEGAKRLFSMLEESGVNAQLQIIEGLDHDFPTDFDERLSHMLHDLEIESSEVVR